MQGGVLAVLGVVAVRLAVDGGFLAYVKPGMRVPLLAAGVSLIALGLVTIWRASASDGDGEGDDQDGHGHAPGHAPPVAWLLLLPVAALVLIAPAPLGAYAAGRQRQATPPGNADLGFAPLPAVVDGARPITIGEFLQRAVWDTKHGLAGERVRLAGFVVPRKGHPDEFQLTRFVISCCAADALAVDVTVQRIDGAVPAANEWVSVEGTWVEPSGGDYDLEAGPPLIAIDADTITPVAEPANPYE